VISSLRSVNALARLTVIDSVKSYSLICLIFFALAGEAVGFLFFDFIHRDIGRASNDYISSIIWVTGFIYLLFYAVSSVAWDDKNRVIHTIMARSISRVEYVLGIFMGHVVILFSLNFILGAIGWWVLVAIQTSLEATFIQQYSCIYYVLTVLGIFAIELVLLAVIHLLSGVIRGSFPVMLMTLSYYFICSGLPVVRESVVSSLTKEDAHSLSNLFKFMTAFFPDFSRLDFKIMVTLINSSKPVFVDLLQVFGLHAFYVIIVLWFASMLYQRQDFN